MKIQYIPVSGGAALLSCRGSGSAVYLPDTVDGLPLLEIRPYAFSDPEAAAARLLPGAEIRSAQTGPSVPGENGQFLGGPSLRELRLPRGIRSIGEYAFYNCTKLSLLRLPEGAAQIGNGALMNCVALEKILIDSSPDQKTCLRELLTEVQREVRVIFESAEGRSVWIFPEYYEESVENTPARIFEYHIYGAGYRYRQCFLEDRLDVENYDEQFLKAKNETKPESLLRIALGRLRHPFRLSPPAAERYRTCLKENEVSAAVLLVREDDPEGLSFLAGNGIFTQNGMETVAEEASRLGHAGCLAVLLREQRRLFAPKKKTFDL